MDKRTEKLVLELEELKLAFVELAHAVGDRIPEGSHLEALVYRWGGKKDGEV
jgi:hypothetical protein